MFKSKFKGFISGFLLATVIFTASIATYSVTGKNLIEVVYNNIKIVVDGKPVSFGTDSLGKPIEPFIYNGTTYLPIRSVGVALGKPVSWDGNTKTVSIGKANVSDADLKLGVDSYFARVARTKWFDGVWNNLSSPDTYVKNISTFTANNGSVYTSGLNYLFDNGDSRGQAEQYDDTYLLNMEYKRFKGTFALSETTKNTVSNTYLIVYGDDKLLYTSESLTSGVLPMEFDIDVSNVISLRVKVYLEQGEKGISPSIGICNAGFYK